MNVFEVRTTRQAEAQMREIARYIALKLNNPDAAEKLMDELGDAFAKLQKNPEKFPLVDEEPWRSEDVRWLKVRNYLVYFWIDIEHAAVQIMGVVYAARDQKRFLDQMDIG